MASLPVPNSSTITEPLLKRAFDLIDKDGDGNLQLNEFTSGCDAMGFGLSTDECTKVFNLIDADGSGEIDFGEFCGFIQSNDAPELKAFRERLTAIIADVSRETLQNAFDFIDKNGDGELQKDEFADGCTSMGIQLTNVELDKIFNCIDKDLSGEIDFKEFEEFLQPKKNDAIIKEFGQFRQRLMKLLHSDVYQDYYHFKINNIVVLQHFKGNTITVWNNTLKPNGKYNKNAQFQTDIFDNGKTTYLKSMANNKYIKLNDNKFVLGDKDDDALFKVHRVSVGHFKLESCSSKGRYIGITPNGVAIQVGKGGPFCRLRGLRKGIKPLFSDPYLFAIKNIIILEHRLGRHFRVNDDKSIEININGGKGTLAQWEAEPLSGGKYVKFKNIVTSKYIQINNNKIDVNGNGDDLSKFIVHPVDGPNHVRLESVKYPGSFLAVNDKGVMIGKGDKPSLITIYRKN